MKKLIYLFILLNLVSCGLNQFDSKVKNEPFDLTKAANLFADSLLIKSNVDTLLIYKIGCSGCIKGSINLVYIYWEKNGIQKFKKLTSDGFTCELKVKYNLLEYYYRHENEINKTSLNEPEIIKFHFQYTDLTWYSNNNKFQINIKDDYFANNQNTAVVNWIYRIESDLFKTENAY